MLMTKALMENVPKILLGSGQFSACVFEWLLFTGLTNSDCPEVLFSCRASES